MRVLIDVSAVPEELTGAGVYTTEIARRLARRDDLTVVLAARRGDETRWRTLAPNAEVHAVGPRPRPVRLAWEQVAGPRIARRLVADVWHGPHYTMPARVHVPAVVTVHDLTFFDHPEWHERSKVWFFRRAIRMSARRAAVVVCVSDATAARLWQVAPPAGEIVVAHHGVDTDRFTPVGDAGADRARLAARGVTGPYLAFVGTLEPRKNVPALIAAFADVAREHRDLRIVLAGRPGWGVEAVDRAVAASGVGERVVRTGYLPGDVLPALLRCAAAVVYPALEEGFGMPVLEAMASGAPVLTTAAVPVSALGSGAVVVTAPDPASLADGLRRVLDPGEARRLRAAGPACARRFSWDAAADAHAAAYRTARSAGKVP